LFTTDGRLTKIDRRQNDASVRRRH